MFRDATLVLIACGLLCGTTTALAQDAVPPPAQQPGQAQQPGDPPPSVPPQPGQAPPSAPGQAGQSPQQPAYPPQSGYPPPPYPPQPYYPQAPYGPPPPPQKRQLVAEAAVKASPWFDFTVSTYSWEQRFHGGFVPGVQFGAYLGGRFRVVARLHVPLRETGDESDTFGSSSSYVRLQAEPHSVLYGASVGYAPVAGETFVFAPGLAFLRSDVGAYGNMLALSLPFEWVTSSSVRIGTELLVGHSFGGYTEEECNLLCEEDTQRQDRESASALMLHFQIGWGLNHPGWR